MEQPISDLQFDTELEWWEKAAQRNRQLGYNLPPEPGDEIYSMRPKVHVDDHLEPCYCRHHRDDLKGIMFKTCKPEAEGLHGHQQNDHVVEWLLAEARIVHGV